jgi:hypothetical protein
MTYKNFLEIRGTQIDKVDVDGMGDTQSIRKTNRSGHYERNEDKNGLQKKIAIVDFVDGSSGAYHRILPESGK